MDFEKLKPEYDDLFSRCVISPARKSAIEFRAAQIAVYQLRYTLVQNRTSVPWYVIGLIHSLEADLSFRTHLHNGDLLSRRTIHVPAGRPPTGEPPFAWEESAADALSYDRVDRWKEWSAAGICFELEGYNGWGYRRYGIHSPYLWAGSNNYTKGKFVEDGVFDHDAVSSQIGAAVLLWQLVVSHNIALPGIPISIQVPEAV